MFDEHIRRYVHRARSLIWIISENHDFRAQRCPRLNIVKIAKEVFARDDDKFVQKSLIPAEQHQAYKSFLQRQGFPHCRHMYACRYQTDVKPLEVVMFMRDVASLPLYIQMKGRGVRTIGDEALRNVTPNADTKDCFYLVICVGVTEVLKIFRLMKTRRPEDYA